MRRYIALLLLLMLACVLPAQAETAESLIVNGGFEIVDGPDLPEGWRQDMWFSDPGVSYLTIEDGGVLGEKIENVKKFYDMGVRLVTLTWNHENAIGYPNSYDAEVMNKGLKPFGKEVVAEMERLGMVVDVSHVSDGVFWDVAELATKPFLASHSNARAVCGHKRNMTDEMIKALADKGGVMGLNLGPEFVGSVEGVTRMEDLVAQILHIRNVGGAGVLALGSDFDGIHGALDVAGPQDWPKLEAALKEAGLSDDELDMMWYTNAERVLRSVLV